MSGRKETLPHGFGELINSNFTVPAAGSNFSFTVPANEVYQILSLWVSFVSDANAADRFLVVNFADSPAHNFASVSSTHAIVASMSRNTFYAIGTSAVNALSCLTATLECESLSLPFIYLLPGFTVQSAVSNLQGTDQVGSLYYQARVWRLE